MPRFTRSIDIRTPIERVFAFHLDPQNLARIAPAHTNTRIVSVSTDPVQKGARITVRSVQAHIPVEIEAEIILLDEPYLLQDRQIRGPFSRWVHTHRFESIPGGTRLTDDIDYALPLGPLGGFAMGRTVARELADNFTHRQEETRRLLEKGDE